MERNFRSSFSNQTIFQADGIVRHTYTSRVYDNASRRVISGNNGRRHAPAFAEFIQR